MRILLPFVSTIADLDAALEIIAGVKRDLSRHKTAFDKDVPVGVMIETPAAAHTCDLMASRVDFFCLGTNDLIQYYLVVDRSDQSAAHLYNPFHPAILRCLHQVYTLLQYSGRPVTVCGEMAGSPFYVPLLIGLGARELSMNVNSILRVSRLVSGISLSECVRLADKVKAFETAVDTEEFLRDHYRQNWAELFPPSLLEARHR